MRSNMGIAPRLGSRPDSAAFDKLRPRACRGEPLDFPRGLEAVERLVAG